MSELKIVYAGDRDISVWVLQHILGSGIRPIALLLSEPERASHADELKALCGYLSDDNILIGNRFRDRAGQKLISDLSPDFIICIHFPYIVPQEILEIPKYGVLNLHPAYLPYNRGWHTPSWALLERTPIGATLHFMDLGIDTGDIIHQQELIPSPADTAHSLYSKLKQLEFEVFKQAWPSIMSGNYGRVVQRQENGTTHKRRDLFSPEIQQINLDETRLVRELLLQLRALTTNNVSEAAYFLESGRTYRIQVTIVEE